MYLKNTRVDDTHHLCNSRETYSKNSFIEKHWEKYLQGGSKEKRNKKNIHGAVYQAATQLAAWTSLQRLSPSQQEAHALYSYFSRTSQNPSSSQASLPHSLLVRLARTAQNPNSS